MPLQVLQGRSSCLESQVDRKHRAFSSCVRPTVGPDHPELHWQESNLFWLHKTTRNSNQAGWCMTKTLSNKQNVTLIYKLWSTSNWSVWSWKSQTKNRTFPVWFRPKKTNCRSDDGQIQVLFKPLPPDSRAALICWPFQFLLAAGVQRWNTSLRIKSHRRGLRLQIYP